MLTFLPLRPLVYFLPYLLIDCPHSAAIEDGFNSLERLSYGKLGWTDEDVTELGACFQEVSCPHVTELDLSWNDMRSGSGLDAIGTAIAHGALHSLQKLNLINCTAVKTLPENVCELLELQVRALTLTRTLAVFCANCSSCVGGSACRLRQLTYSLTCSLI